MRKGCRVAGFAPHAQDETITHYAWRPDMSRRETPLEVAAKGAVAGLVGTAAITVVMKSTPVIMARLGMSMPQPENREAREQSAGEPTEKLAEKVSEGVFEQPIEEDTKQAAGQAIHWSYGAAWGVFY